MSNGTTCPWIDHLGIAGECSLLSGTILARDGLAAELSALTAKCDALQCRNDELSTDALLLVEHEGIVREVRVENERLRRAKAEAERALLFANRLVDVFRGYVSAVHCPLATPCEGFVASRTRPDWCRYEMECTVSEEVAIAEAEAECEVE